MADPSGLKEAAAFKGIHLLCFFYFLTAGSRELGSEWMILNGFPVRVPLGSMMDIQEKSAPTSSPTER